MSMPEVGMKAPEFSLQDQNGETVSLNQFKGQPVLVYFYPKAMTPGCTVQACSLRDSEKALKKLSIKVLGISPDSVSRLKKFEEKEDLNFTLLADENHSVADTYGVWQKKKMMGKEYMGVARTSFIVGSDGKIKHVIDDVDTKTHHTDVMNWVKENLT